MSCSIGRMPLMQSCAVPLEKVCPQITGYRWGKCVRQQGSRQGWATGSSECLEANRWSRAPSRGGTRQSPGPKSAEKISRSPTQPACALTFL